MTKVKEFDIIKEYMDLGDARLNKRSGKIFQNLSLHLDKTIPAAFPNRGEMKAVYNFFKHEAVTMKKLNEGHSKTHQRNRKNVHKQVLLAPQDTTELDFSNKRSAKELGPLNHLHQRGLRLHSSLIMSEKGVPSGVFKQTSIIRSDEKFGKRNNRKVEPIEDKESNRWLEHHDALEDFYNPFPNIEVFDICDREADMMELFAAYRGKNVHLIVRSKFNRRVINEDGSTTKLWTKLDESSVKKTYTIEINDRSTGKQRKAKVELKFCHATIELAAPNQYQKDLKPQKIWAVQIQEINPPKGKKPIKWIILTTKEVNDTNMARTIIRYYELRWIIERFHYVLKSGAEIKELQLTTQSRILNAITCYSIASVKVMTINYLARFYPKTKITEIGILLRHVEALFTYAKKYVDKKIQFQKDEPPSIRKFVIVVAQLGGFTNFSNQPFPGLKTFWKGWSIFNIIKNSSDTLLSKN